MSLVSLELDAFRDQISELRRSYGIAELSVFGSVARGEDRPDSEVHLVSKNSLHWVI